MQRSLIILSGNLCPILFNTEYSEYDGCVQACVKFREYQLQSSGQDV